jgi:lipid-binding SYLF domain-containing protein
MGCGFISTLILTACLLCGGLTIAACSATPDTAEARDQLVDDAQSTVARFQSDDSRTGTFFESAYGWAVFPKITKGGAGIAGAYGRGIVYQGGAVVGYASVTQGSIGAQLGGMSWAEIVFFQNQWAFDKFKSDQFAAAADASWAGPKQGGTNTLNYDDGVMIFTMDTRGLAVTAAVGAQQFNYEPNR